MPEVLSRYPDVTLKVLKSAGAKCGAGEEQAILVKCPKERFCSLPGGEICVYGLGEVSQMTQIGPKQIAKICKGPAKSSMSSPGLALEIPAIAGALALGLLLGWLWRRRHRKKE
jgi:hypothetical protein